jgi:hypothetical protein
VAVVGIDRIDRGRAANDAPPNPHAGHRNRMRASRSRPQSCVWRHRRWRSPPPVSCSRCRDSDQIAKTACRSAGRRRRQGIERSPLTNAGTSAKIADVLRDSPSAIAQFSFHVQMRPSLCGLLRRPPRPFFCMAPSGGTSTG